MRYESAVVEGAFLARRKRFFVDVELDDGARVVAHCSATGAMTGLSDVGQRVRLLPRPRESRGALDWRLEQVRAGDSWVVVNTARPNQLAWRAVLSGKLRLVPRLERASTEPPFPDGGRADLLLHDAGGASTWVEVKGVTLLDDDGRTARFPDAPTSRGAGHLDRLAARVRDGERAIQLFLVLRDDCSRCATAPSVDPDYAQAMGRALESGVEVVCARVQVGADGLCVERRLPFHSKG